MQELDHPPVLAPVSKQSGTVHDVSEIADRVDEALTTASSPHRGPAFLDVLMDQLFSHAEVTLPGLPQHRRLEPDGDSLRVIAHLLAKSCRPVLVLGTDVWADGAEEAALRFVDATGVAVITNGMGRGVIPRGHPSLVTKARSVALGQCDLAVVVGTPLDFRLGYGSFGGKQQAPRAQVVHIADTPGQVSRHATLAGSACGDLTSGLDGLLAALESSHPARPDWSPWTDRLRDLV